jgi:hypothetical protein
MTPGQRPIAILLDLLAFAAGLGMAWAFGWQARDLVWGLWLSSLVVGFTTIVVGIGRGVFHGSRSLRTPGDLLGFVISLVLGGFLLTFFTIHFGGFHLVHSMFLNLFFPIVDATDLPDAGLYAEVFRRYWPFLAAAFLAERAVLRTAWTAPLEFRQGGGQNVMTAPYRNVVRMHLLIFFFAFASAMGLDSFGVYAVVFAVYFFPWRTILGRREPAVPSANP